MSSVDQLVRLTRWRGPRQTDADWERAEEDLGIALPLDFRELAERFPDGVFQGYLDFSASPGSLVDLAEGPLEDLRRWREDASLSLPFPLWPEPGGIFPWTLGSRDEIFFWLRSDPDPSHWPVVWCHGEDFEWEQFAGSATDFLIALVTGQIDARTLGSPTFPPPPRFDQIAGLRYRPTAGSNPPSDEEIARIKSLVRKAHPDAPI